MILQNFISTPMQGGQAGEMVNNIQNISGSTTVMMLLLFPIGTGSLLAHCVKTCDLFLVNRQQTTWLTLISLQSTGPSLHAVHS